MYFFVLPGKTIFKFQNGVLLILYILLSVLALLLLVSFCTAELDLVFNRKADDDYIAVRIGFLKVFKLKYELHYIDVILNREGRPGIGIAHKRPSKGSGKSFFDFDAIRDVFKRRKELRRILGRPVKYITDRMRIDRVSLDALIGCESASATAIAVGSLYMLSYNLLRVAGFVPDRSNSEINVRPQYSKPVFEMHMHCIISIRIANIIIGAAKMFFAFVFHMKDLKFAG